MVVFEEVQIFGDWKDFTFHKASNKDFDKICQHLRSSYLKDETMHASLGWSEENAKTYDEMVRVILRHGISIYVTVKDSDEIIGVTLSMDSRLEDISSYCTSKNAISINGLTDKLQEVTTTKQIFDNNYYYNNHDDYFMEVFLTSVDSKYRRIGIASEMCARTINYAKQLGFKMIKVEFSCPATRAIGKKFGFIEIDKIYFKDYLDETGNKIFPNMGDNEFITSAVKVL